MNFSLKLFCFALVTIIPLVTADSDGCDYTDLYICLRQFNSLTPEEMNQKEPVCKAVKRIALCQDKFVKNCPKSPAVSSIKKNLNEYEEQHGDVCGPASTNSSSCPDAFKIFKCPRHVTTLSPIQMADSKLLCNATFEALNCRDAFYKRCPDFSWLTEDILEDDKDEAERKCPSSVSMAMSSFWVVLTLTAWSGLRQFL